MKLAELVCNCDWANIRSAILRLYPDDRKNMAGFESIFGRLQTLTPVITEMRIVLEEVFDDGENERYTHVCGKDGTLKKEENPEGFKDDEIGNQEMSYGIEFVEWEEWIGMDIDQESLSKYSAADILVHCLWEMTFYGYTQEAIQKQAKQLKEDAENAKMSLREE